MGSLPPIVAKTAPSVLAPSPQGERKRKELEEKKENANAKGF
jgi:hypothetical protein